MNDFNNILEFSGNNCSTKYDFSADNIFTLSVAGKEILGVKPVSFGKIGEKVGMVSVCRDHVFMEYDNVHRMEIQTDIPFGSEPSINRNIEHVSNHIKFTTDIEIKGYFPADRISVDDIFLPGEWVRFAIIDIPDDSPQIPEIKWVDIGTDNILFDSKSPFLIVLFESIDGTIIEIGAGSDLWRWKIAEEININSSFKVEKSDDGLSIKRDVVIWDEESDIPSRTWRFKWYCAWMEKGETFEKLSGKSTAFPATNQKFEFSNDLEQVFNLNKSDWHKSAQVVCGDSLVDTPCFFSGAVIKHMKKWIRAAGAHHNTKFIINNIEPHVCHSASHASRANKKVLYHFDLIAILDFWFWADRQLRKSGSSLKIIPNADCCASELPSMRGLQIGVKNGS